MMSCHYTGYVHVQQESIDASFLASSHVGTPDPRSENPPMGQRLLIRWDFPQSIFEQNLTLSTTVRFWDCKEETFHAPILHKNDSTFLFFPKEKGKILTYRVMIETSSGKEVALWEHPFWTPLIILQK